jgi:hypothetical protein
MRACSQPPARLRRNAAVTLRATGDDSSADKSSDAKEAALRRLAGTDAPKGPPAKKVEKEAPLPEWAFFALPIVGAVSAFAFQYFRLGGGSGG